VVRSFVDLFSFCFYSTRSNLHVLLSLRVDALLPEALNPCRSKHFALRIWLAKIPVILGEGGDVYTETSVATG
jgi:hypothetical protein